MVKRAAEFRSRPSAGWRDIISGWVCPYRDDHHAVVSAVAWLELVLEPALAFGGLSGNHRTDRQPAPVPRLSAARCRSAVGVETAEAGVLIATAKPSQTASKTRP